MYSATPFSSRWTASPCRKAAVSRRYHSPDCRTRLGYRPPSATSVRTPGLRRPVHGSIPYISSPAKTAASKASSAQVTRGKRAFSGSACAGRCICDSLWRGSRSSRSMKRRPARSPLKGALVQTDAAEVSTVQAKIRAFEKTRLRLKGFSRARSTTGLALDAAQDLQPQAVPQPQYDVGRGHERSRFCHRAGGEALLRHVL